MSGKDHTYTAVFDQNEITMTVIWQNWNGTELQRKTYYKSGTEPSYSGSTPTRPDDNYRYTFSGWTLLSSSDPYTKIYRAQYTSVSKITVTWKNWDNSVLQTKTYFGGDPEPTYSGSTPTRPDNIPSSGNGTRYTFSGWNLISSSTFAKNYQAKFNTTTLYVWNRYTSVQSSSIGTIYSTSWYDGDGDNDSDSDDSTDLSLIASDGGFWAVREPDMSSTTANTFEDRILEEMQTEGSKVGAVFAKTTEFNNMSQSSMGGRNNLYGRYTKMILIGDYRLPASTKRRVTLYVGNDTSSDYATVITTSAHNPFSSNTDNTYYYLRSAVYGHQKEMGTYIDYVISTSSSAYPSNGEHTDGYWYVKR